MKRLAIIGSGDLGQQIAYHAINDGHYKPIGFFDDYKNMNSIIFNLPVLGGIKEVEDLYNNNKFDVLMIGIGYNHFAIRANLFNKFSKNIPFGTIIHSSAYVDKSCKIGSGVFIYPRCILDMEVEICNNVLLNVGCVIAHHSIIGQHSFLSPAVNVAGFVKVGEKVNLGIGSVVIDNINIANDIKTGAGTVVIKNLEASGLYVGIPAIFKKEFI